MLSAKPDADETANKTNTSTEPAMKQPTRTPAQIVLSPAAERRHRLGPNRSTRRPIAPAETTVIDPLRVTITAISVAPAWDSVTAAIGSTTHQATEPSSKDAW